MCGVRESRGRRAVLNEEWLTGWAARIEAATARALRDVVSMYPFDAGDHSVGPPLSPTQLAVLRERMPWVPGELLALYRHVGPVSMPDITNGYFLYPPAGVLTDMYDLYNDGRADHIGKPFTEEVDVVVFGSN